MEVIIILKITKIKILQIDQKLVFSMKINVLK